MKKSRKATRKASRKEQRQEELREEELGQISGGVGQPTTAKKAVLSTATNAGNSIKSLGSSFNPFKKKPSVYKGTETVRYENGIKIKEVSGEIDHQT